MNAGSTAICLHWRVDTVAALSKGQRELALGIKRPVAARLAAKFRNPPVVFQAAILGDKQSNLAK